MIAIGTDIVEIQRVQTVLERHGERFSARILTPREQSVMASSAYGWRYLAKRFAAKEAIAKCLGTGIGIELSWQDMDIEKGAGGAPVVRLTPRASALAAALGGQRILLSLSDERAYAVAFAALVA